MRPAQGVFASWGRLAGIALALAPSGCTFTKRHAIPPPVVEPPPPLRIDATVGVRLEPGLEARERVLTRRDGVNELRSVVPVGSAVRSLCDGLLPQVFARTRLLAGAEPPQGVDAVLDVRLVSFGLSFPSGLDSTPCRARFVLAWDLATAAGAPIARWTTETTGEQPPPVFGVCIGDAVALALQDAGRTFADQLLSDPAVRAWRERAGIAASPPPERPARPTPPSPPELPEGAQVAWAADEPAPEAPPSTPARKASPPRPDTSAFRGGIGWLAARNTPGALEDPSGGPAFLLGATYRPAPPLGIDLDMTFAAGEFSSSTAPAPGLFETKSSHMTLSSLGISAGIRGIAPLRGFQPWAGAGVVVLVSTLTLTGDTLGIPGQVEERGVAPGVYAAAGLDLGVSAKWLVGGQCRWIAAEQSFDRLSAGQTASIGGLTCFADVSRRWP